MNINETRQENVLTVVQPQQPEWQAVLLQIAAALSGLNQSVGSAYQMTPTQQCAHAAFLETAKSMGIASLIPPTVKIGAVNLAAQTDTSPR